MDRETGIVSASAKMPSKGPKVVSELRVKRSMDGGHVITHHYEGYQHEPKPYKFGPGENDRAAAHITRHTGIGLDGASEEEPENAEPKEAAGKGAKGKPAVKGAGKHEDAEEPED